MRIRVDHPQDGECVDIEGAGVLDVLQLPPLYETVASAATLREVSRAINEARRLTGVGPSEVMVTFTASEWHALRTDDYVSYLVGDGDPSVVMTQICGARFSIAEPVVGSPARSPVVYGSISTEGVVRCPACSELTRLAADGKVTTIRDACKSCGEIILAAIGDRAVVISRPMSQLFRGSSP